MAAWQELAAVLCAFVSSHRALSESYKSFRPINGSTRIASRPFCTCRFPPFGRKQPDCACVCQAWLGGQAWGKWPSLVSVLGDFSIQVRPIGANLSILERDLPSLGSAEARQAVASESLHSPDWLHSSEIQTK